jgi:hypothetical protein
MIKINLLFSMFFVSLAGLFVHDNSQKGSSNYYVMAPMELAAEEIVFSDVIEKDQFGSASIFRFVPCGILVPDACTITSWGLECEVPRSCHDPVGPGPYLDIHCNFEGYRGCGPSGTGPLKCGAIVNCPEIPPM